MTEPESFGTFQIVICEKPEEQLMVGIDNTHPDNLVLIHLQTKIGFSMHRDFAHELSHLIHEALEHLTGGDLQEEETSNEKVTLH